MQEATYTKTENTTSTSHQLTFKEKEQLKSKENPEERAKTKVYECYERPMSYKTCLKYGHIVKTCRETIATRAKCSKQGHNKDNCASAKVTCCICGADHQAFSRSCPLFKRETDIFQLQTKERTPRLQTIRKLLRLTKSPTTSEQESQADSSEDTNVMNFFFENFGNEETTHRLYRPTARILC